MVFAGVALAALGCEVVAGIEDRTFVAAAASESAECAAYCDAVMDNCVGENAVYSSRETCLGVCAVLPAGESNERTSENTLACRAYQAELAGQIDAADAQTTCWRAGPGGDGYCGGECENYCFLDAAACPEAALDVDECVEKCAGLRDGDGFNLEADHEGDSLECRLVHVTSATVDPEAHCEHAQLNSPEWCIDAADATPDCAEYCRLTQVACGGEVAVYESEAQCLAACAALPVGTAGDRSENTVGCRLWHARNALLDPATHCAHAGPGGDGHCGHEEDGAPGNCVAYCILVEAACAADFDENYGDQGTCRTLCAEAPAEYRAEDDSYYSVEAGAVPQTLDCRMLAATRALSDPSACPEALGGGACE